MFRFLILLVALIAMTASSPIGGILEPTAVLDRIEPQPAAPANTEHGQLVPAYRYAAFNSFATPLTYSAAYGYPFNTPTAAYYPQALRYVALNAAPFEAHNYRISY